MPTALITGASGQDGSYLAEYLKACGYQVVGTTRDLARARQLPYASALDGIELVEQPLDSRPAVGALLRSVQPDEIYHLAGPTRIGASWTDPAGTLLGIVMPTILILESALAETPRARIFFAGSCDVFAAEERAQDESAPRTPVSPYGRAKLEAETIVAKYREAHGLFAVSGILFNHESPRRDASMVSRKIASAAARIAKGSRERLTLGTVDVRRDWGFAGDHVRAMALMLRQPDPVDMVIGTGEAHSIVDLYQRAFRHVGLNGSDHVDIDPGLFRPDDPPLRLADPTLARERLGWTPEVDFERLVAMMVDHELAIR